MNIVEVTTEEQLKELYDAWAMTWEGLVESDFGIALETCCRDGKDGTGYVTTGELMNTICHLTGSNAYPNGLVIFSIKNYQGLALQYGARWMADIVDNNAYRQGYHPFKDDFDDDTDDDDTL